MATEIKGSSLGLFFTEETIVVVQARAARGHVEITTYGVLQTPPGTIEEGMIVDPAKLGNAIRAALRKTGISAKSAHVAIFSPGYTMRALQMPDVPAKEQRILIRGELEATAVLPTGGGTFDYIWLQAPPATAGRQAEVYAYYTVDQMVENVRESLRAAGLQLNGMEPASLSMIRSYLTAAPQRRPIAFLCSSENHSDLCLHDGEKIRHIRRIPAGWGDYARETNPSSLAANTVAPLTGLLVEEEPEVEDASFANQPPFPEDQSGIAPDSGTDAAKPMTSRNLNRPSSTTFLAAEIQRTLAFYERESPDAPRPEAMVVLGMGKIIHDFRRALADSMPLPFAEPLTSAFSVALPQDDVAGSAGAYLAAIGAAIRDMEPAFPQLDISRQENLAKARQRAPVQLLSGMSIGTAWALGSAIAAIALTMMQSTDEQRTVQIRQELETIKQQRAPLLRGQQIFDEIHAARKRAEVPAAPVLGRVAASATEGVALTGLQIGEDGKVRVDGRARAASDIQRFATLLGLGHAVQAPSFEMMRQDDKNGLQFRIAGAYPKVSEPAPQAQTASTTGP